MRCCQLAHIRFAFVFLVTTCAAQKNTRSDLLGAGDGTLVPIRNGIIELNGFIAGGSYSEHSPEAVQEAHHSCDDVIMSVYQTLDRFRIAHSTTNSECQNPKNETPFGRGYFYVYRPTIQYRVDPEDIVVLSDGPAITGREAAQHELYAAYLSFNEMCFSAIEKLKTELGPALIAASCGDAKSTVRMSYYPSHNMNLPNLTISSPKMKIYLRKNALKKATTFRTLQLSRKAAVSLSDVATAIVPAVSDRATIVTTSFAGALTKIDLEQGRVVWEKNLTNPTPNSVRETSALNTVAVSNNGRFYIVGGDYGFLAMVDGDTGAKLRVFSCDPTMFAPNHYQALRMDKANRSLFSIADVSSYPVEASSYNRMKFPDLGNSPVRPSKLARWDLETGKVAWSLDFKSARILSIGLTPDESFLFVVTNDRIAIFKTASGQAVREYLLSEYEGPLTGSIISGATFSDDMRLLAFSAFSGVIILDTQTGKMLHRLRAGFEAQLGNPGFSNNGSRLKAFNAHGAVYEWNIITGELTGEGHNDAFALTNSGPANMPILSHPRGSYLIESISPMSLGIGVSLSRLQPISKNETICRFGPGSDLAPLTIRKMGQAAIWTANFTE